MPSLVWGWDRSGWIHWLAEAMRVVSLTVHSLAQLEVAIVLTHLMSASSAKGGNVCECILTDIDYHYTYFTLAQPVNVVVFSPSENSINATWEPPVEFESSLSNYV